MKRLNQIADVPANRKPTVLAQRAKAEKLVFGDDRWRASRIGVIPQMLHLLPSLSALDNVRLAQEVGLLRERVRSLEATGSGAQGTATGGESTKTSEPSLMQPEMKAQMMKPTRM